MLSPSSLCKHSSRALLVTRARLLHQHSVTLVRSSATTRDPVVQVANWVVERFERLESTGRRVAGNEERF